MELKKPIELDDIHTWSVATEDFLAHLHRHGALTRENRSDEAQRVLEKAFDSQKDPFGQAALGLVYFKLGIYPRALAIYRRLVDEYPGEPTLRLNLALIYLKTGQTHRAKELLEELVGLHPEYRKAHGYLGVAYQRLGEYVKAQAAFEKADAKHMAERMARFIEPEKQHEALSATRTSTTSGTPMPPAEAIVAEPETEKSNLVKFIDNAVAVPSPLSESHPTMHEPMLASEVLSMTCLPRPISGRFLVSDSGYLLMDIDPGGFARLDGIRFVNGEGLSYKPAARRFRGRDSEELFGTAESPLFRIEGKGRLGFHRQNGIFTALSLGDQVAYIREEFVFAFDDNLSFENGRMPSGEEMLVHYRGLGSLVLKTPTRPESLEVTPAGGVIIPARDLVGWIGRILPKPATASPFDPSLSALELTGEGVLLICLPD
ncbi:MAG: tetratricopeptide repeat protein [Deltaproteobacteria bacterium]|nr:tetratricopeptide repeat protein [Deltaproteobacteria bacterium]